MDDQVTVMSPILICLQEGMAGESSTVLENFWQEIIGRGTPLVEAIPGSERDVRVTFLYRNDR